MSVLIKDMELPQNCAECPFLYDNDACYVSGMWSDMRFMLICSNGHTNEYRLGEFPFEEKRVDWCPLSEAPSAERRGRWETIYCVEDPEHGPILISCSECNFATEYKTNYCPNCGAKMEAEEFVTDGTEFKIDDKVLFIDEEMHATAPRYYPACGTVGEVVGFFGEESLLVQWPVGSTSDDDIWYCEKTHVRKAEE